MLDEFLIRYSAPTLAGLKTGSLFWYPCEGKEELERTVNKWSEIFHEKGLELTVMRKNGQRALLYVYRVDRLEQDLKRVKTCIMLSGAGYAYKDTGQAVEILKGKIQGCRNFPHEIGLFLGYPEDDVKGFMENRGKNCKCCGRWKVYSNEENAQKIFCKFKKCEMIYERLFLNGRPVRELIVAA